MSPLMQIERMQVAPLVYGTQEQTGAAPRRLRSFGPERQVIYGVLSDWAASLMFGSAQIGCLVEADTGCNPPENAGLGAMRSRQRPAESLARWDGSFQHDYLELSIAAAMVLREAGHPGAATEPGHDFNEKLNIAAGALARLLTIYGVDEISRAHTPIAPDAVAGEFVEGAAAFRHHAGYMVRSLGVRRSDLASALSLIRRIGVPFATPDATRRGSA